MFVGHGLLAFALVALGCRALGWSRERTLTVAVLAFAFGTLPDVDIAYAPVGLLGGVTGAFDAAEAFWQTGNLVHRAMTHSLPVALLAALAFALWSVRSRTETFGRTRRRGAALLAVGLLAGLVAVATAVTGGLAGVVLALFSAVGLAVTTLAARRGVGPVTVWATALFGLLSHPFGDMLTGEPPVLLYPFETTVVAERVVLHPDPTLHLLGAFAVELATVWLAVYAALSLSDRRLRDHVRPRAAVGFGYAAAAVALPAPTLAASYQFVFSVLALGMVGPVRAARHDRRRFQTALLSRRPARTDLPTAVVTGLTAVTLGAVGYTMAYLVV
ncbi:metal-dependent hydrolase [Halorientalis litorea]|uniref:metal-dependent hydrolase n=1 Tax=Halorientalis litorea TaxID=2931977 RepID=UPI001FF61A02|nr:metal-dependent hydrolase [Halorientalis litorea]